MDHIILNGALLPADQPIFKASNRAFRYGDSLFESIRKSGGYFPLLNEHWHRLESGRKALGFQEPPDWSVHRLREEIERLCFPLQEARIRLTLFRNDGGLYGPSTDDTSYLLEATPLNGSFPWHVEGLMIDLCTQWKIAPSPLSRYKTGSALVYVLAAREKKRSGWDDCLLMNTHERMVEASSSNLFARIRKQWITPSLTEGCLDGVMRRKLIDLLRNSGEEVIEGELHPRQLKEAQAICLTNAVQGVRWVRQFQEKIFDPAPLGTLQKTLRDWMEKSCRDEAQEP